MNPKNKKNLIGLGVAFIFALLLYIIYINRNNQPSNHPTAVITETVEITTTESIDTSDSNQQRQSVETSEESTTVSSDSAAVRFDPNIYRTDLIQEYGKDQFDVSEYDTVDELIEQLVTDYQVDFNQVGISFYNLKDDHYYGYNDNNFIVAASTAKIPVVMAFIDLINQGQYDYETELLYNDYFNYEGGGNIANSPAQASYSIADLMAEAIRHSDNTAWYTLVFNYPNNFGGVANYILQKTGNYNIPEYFYMDNYGSAYLYFQLLYIVATQPEYDYLVQLMRETDPPQLFTSFIHTDVLANKYGRVDGEINDVAIYYENDQPQYILTAFTTNVPGADHLLEDLSLYVNLWYRDHYILN